MTLPTDDARATPAPAVDRRRLRLAISTTLFALPILLADNLPQDPRPSQAVRVETTSELSKAPPTTTTTTTSTTMATTTTTTTTATTASPTTARPTTTTTTARPTTTRAPTTTTTAPPTTAVPTTTVAPAVNEQSGRATWYYWRPGECAHRTLPRGTAVTVTNVATGAVATCVVTDRGPYGNAIIDLDQSVFAQLAPLETGVINVHIRW
ncbi:MAG: septal ring lytic transglycosylase RlpA family protein [Acidimicrobiales bacterium]